MLCESKLGFKDKESERGWPKKKPPFTINDLSQTHCEGKIWSIIIADKYSSSWFGFHFSKDFDSGGLQGRASSMCPTWVPWSSGAASQAIKPWSWFCGCQIEVENSSLQWFALPFAQQSWQNLVFHTIVYSIREPIRFSHELRDLQVATDRDIFRSQSWACTNTIFAILLCKRQCKWL